MVRVCNLHQHHPQKYTKANDLQNMVLIVFEMNLNKAFSRKFMGKKITFAPENACPSGSQHLFQ
jgi:hypothetical protein